MVIAEKVRQMTATMVLRNCMFAGVDLFVAFCFECGDCM